MRIKEVRTKTTNQSTNTWEGREIQLARYITQFKRTGNHLKTKHILKYKSAMEETIREVKKQNHKEERKYLGRGGVT